MNAIGIMQGRLSPRPAGRAQSFPAASWLREFALAKSCGFACVEWLVTADTFDRNPLVDSERLPEIGAAMAASGVDVRSVCADCFIETPFIGTAPPDRQQASRRLDRLIVNAHRVGAGVVVVPLLEGNRLRDRSSEQELFEVLQSPAAAAHRLGVRIALESDLTAAAVGALIDRAQMPAVGACLDGGNAVANGYDPVAEIPSLGSRLVAVHIKDRTREGESRMLGHGDVDLPGVLAALQASAYRGPLILETPVGEDPAASARDSLALLRACLATL